MMMQFQLNLIAKFHYLKKSLRSFIIWKPHWEGQKRCWPCCLGKTISTEWERLMLGFWISLVLIWKYGGYIFDQERPRTWYWLLTVALPSQTSGYLDKLFLYSVLVEDQNFHIWTQYLISSTIFQVLSMLGHDSLQFQFISIYARMHIRASVVTTHWF